MKIVVIAQGSIPAQTANSIQNMKMAGAMAELGNEVQMIAPGVKSGRAWTQLANHYGLSHQFDIRWIPFIPFLRRYDFALRAVRAAQDWGAELIYTRLPQAATLAAARRLPTVFELHDLPSGTMGPWLLRRFLNAPGARRLVVNTNHLADEVRKRYRLHEKNEFLLLAHNGVDLERYSKLPAPKSARTSLGLPEGFTVGYTGHLYAGRGIELILELAGRLPGMQFLLVGGRPEDVAQQKQQARDLSNVQFVGFVPNAELPRYQAACDVFLMPHSRKVSGSSGADIAEFTNPLKMFEYLACGRPILASDLPIFREILNKENAMILPGGKLQAWVDALNALQNSPKRRAALSKAGKNTAAQFSWEQRARRVLQGLEKGAKI
ncbi:MAG: glycosyltransferase family 4 protein [Chloroflexi bacterium]|nr:glycosyltransferase family 4 protein [Chloroflexota bacterium]